MLKRKYYAEKSEIIEMLNNPSYAEKLISSVVVGYKVTKLKMSIGVGGRLEFIVEAEEK